MITEDYVSFETAKLLKEKGFDWETYGYWDLTTETHTQKIGIETTSKNWNYKWNPFSLPMSAPTLQMAMKWLRKKHKIYVEVRITNHSMSEMVNIPRYYWVCINAEKVRWMDESTAHGSMSFKTYEEACEDAIKYCLENLI